MNLSLKEQALQHYIKVETQDFVERTVEVAKAMGTKLSEDDALELIRQGIVRVQADNKLIEEIE